MPGKVPNNENIYQNAAAVRAILVYYLFAPVGRGGDLVLGLVVVVDEEPWDAPTNTLADVRDPG